MKKGILAKTIEWRKHLRPFRKRQQWREERKAEQSEIQQEYDDLINGTEVVFFEETDQVYEEETHPPYPHF